MERKIRKILVANRGEIAVRVMRTCAELNIETVAVYSDPDADAPFVRMANEAYALEGVTAAQTYLDQGKILDIARRSNAGAIHPGYGFLSENEDFAHLIEKKGLIFIGPSADAIRKLGDKTSARKIAESVGVPIVPGITDPIANIADATRVASQVTYPILLKAAGGGGGKGMRIVHKEGDLDAALRAAKSEAKSAFADDRVYLEKYLSHPRHIEVQVLADAYGNIIHLGERECSIQRRHQKVIEESPSVVVDPALREQITGAAMKICRESGYRNAGTVEFLLDENENFYFLEVNTRLQVEHPVTEMRTGIDIVREQILISEGDPLSVRQESVVFSGHSIECRIYAEDPSNNFFPSTGKIVYLRPPSGLHLREDRGVEAGDEVTAYYDPMIAKLIAWGKSRPEAIDRMIRALKEYEIFGVKNNITLCLWILNQPNFRQGNFDTTFLQNEFTSESIPPPPDSIQVAAALLAALHQNGLTSESPHQSDGDTPRKGWILKRNDGLR